MIDKRDYVPIIFLLACTAALLSPVLFTGRSFFLRDLTYLFHPWRTFSAQMLQAGHLPLWNPYAFCGMPFLANWQSAVLYPFSILFYLFPFPAALKAYGLVHFFMAGFFAYLFGRAMGLNRAGACGLAVVFALNGYLLTRSEFLSHFGTDAWTFAPLLFVDAPLLAALSLALAFLAGHQVFLLLAAITLTYRLATLRKSGAARSLMFSSMAFLAAGCLCAVQLLPTLELSTLSSRLAEGLDSRIAMLNALTLPDLARILSPIFSSSVIPITGEKLPWPTTFHIGFVAVCAAIIGVLASRRPRLRLFAFAVASLGLLLALGASTPVYPWLYDHLSILRYMRYPSQYLLLTVTGAAILAGIGFGRIGPGRDVVLLCALELLVAGFAFQITAPDSYFVFRPPAVDELRKNLSLGRFILSPGTEKDRRFRESDTVRAWLTARSYLYGLTCLPYRLKNAYGSGEPLSPATTEALVNKAYSQKTPQGSLPYFDDMGVAVLLCRDPIPAQNGFSLVRASPPVLYRLATSTGMLVISDKLGTISAIDDGVPGRTVCTITSERGARVTWKETRYPGWQLYVNGTRTTYASDGDLRQWRLEPGESRIVEVFRPHSFHLGLFITLASLAALVIYGIMRTCLA